MVALSHKSNRSVRFLLTDRAASSEHRWSDCLGAENDFSVKTLILLIKIMPAEPLC
jgi:hypothetical protein